MGLVKTRRLAYPPLVGVRDPCGTEHAERSECRARTSRWIKGRNEAAIQGLESSGSAHEVVILFSPTIGSLTWQAET